MDVVLKLRELRRMREMSQKDVADLCGVGEKTISSFETGERIESLKLSQLRRILQVYGVSESEFFSDSIERRIAPWETQAPDEEMHIVEQMGTLPSSIQKTLLDKFRAMVETAADVHALGHGSSSTTYRGENNPEWQMLTSRN